MDNSLPDKENMQGQETKIEAPKEKTKISAENLKEKIEHSSNLTVVNVQDEDQFDACHIKGSVNAPLSHLKIIAKDWDRTREIIIYDANSEDIKKETALGILVELGFTKIKKYQGGLKEWKEKKFNCFCKYKTDKIDT